MSNTTIAFDVVTVIERNEGKTYFRKIGVAFAAKEGDGYNISLDALPISGTLLLRTPKAKADQDGGAQ
ncbi:MAG: hypothetical protein AB7G40_05525 [Hyphomonadaceae bacterium]